jgi:hypothetical protein
MSAPCESGWAAENAGVFHSADLAIDQNPKATAKAGWKYVKL